MVLLSLRVHGRLAQRDGFQRERRGMASKHGSGMAPADPGPGLVWVLSEPDGFSADLAGGGGGFHLMW